MIQFNESVIEREKQWLNFKNKGVVNFKKVEINDDSTYKALTSFSSFLK